MYIFGISRSPRFSPNSFQRDAAILSAVVERLEAQGHSVEVVSEDHLKTVPEGRFIFSMARDEGSLSLLAQAEAAGSCVINSALALLRADRAGLTDLFRQHAIPQPLTSILSTEAACVEMPFPVWLKRGDACAQSSDDVSFVENAAALATALADFRERGIAEAVVSEHLAGDLLKFYGVEGTPFFYFYYPTAGQHFSKFGWERYNGAPSGFAFDAAALKDCADRMARLSGLSVYGGDCIVSADGSFSVIDFNDWPSFSLCKEAAAEAIVNKLLETFNTI